MTATPTFESYDDNEEDVVLWRALRPQTPGRYVEVLQAGGNEPEDTSATRALYEKGWSGLVVTPDGELAARRRKLRERDVTVTATASRRDAKAGTPPPPERRVSSLIGGLGWDASDIHAMIVDFPDAELSVLEGTDLTAWRPWIVVVRAREEPAGAGRANLQAWMSSAGYEQTMFDGASVWFVSEERSPLLAAKLRYPARPFDSYTTRAFRAAQSRLADLEAGLARVETAASELRSDVAAWRSKAVSAWAAQRCAVAERDEIAAELAAVGADGCGHLGEIERLQADLADMRHSTSWQVTAPLRRVASLRKPHP
jgi:hypothetical protein